MDISLNTVREIPNYLTYLRLILIPLFVWLMIEPSRSMVYWATAVFVIAAATDYLDGFVARKFGAVSEAGKLLDPLADKLLVMSALVMLVAQRSDLYGEPWVPGWMVVVILGREIWVTGLRAVAAAGGTIIAAGSAGKFKSFLQMLAIMLLLLHDLRFPFLGTVTCQIVGLYMLLISIVFSVWGAMEYTTLVLQPKNQAGS
ncbi:MAG: CDP-diacylglycerol--glycerol-3-phosphate 3-phosphatidyltransferase [Proteobacteria bacterium]|nr:MAG: CDP-diacylglycerol--glycerol-3-phosphate 3-phosphatidyltransferase [Pseudomonadota bacterium]